MKVAILTFHKAINYGAVLQAYALCETIRKQGHECNILDYSDGFFENVYIKPIRFSMNHGLMEKTKFLYKWLFHHRQFVKKKKKYQRIVCFSKQYLPLSPSFTKNNLKDANGLFDCFVVGSDQVWNSALSGFDTSYFLDFVDADKTKLSYAASIGKGYLTGFERDCLKEFLPSFSALSMREKNGIELVSNLCGICGVSRVLDPTLLLEKKEWERIAISGRIKLPERFLLVYCIQPPSPLFLNSIKKYAEKNKLIVVSLSPISGIQSLDVSDASIESFLYLFSRAEAVFATSFHALVFATIFHKPFFYENNQNVVNTNARYKDYCDYLRIGDRSIVEGGSLKDTINWQTVDNEIENRRLESLEFLRRSIK